MKLAENYKFSDDFKRKKAFPKIPSYSHKLKGTLFLRHCKVV